MSKQKKNYIHILIGLLIYVLFSFIIPPSEPLTLSGMRILGIFFMCVYYWITLSTAWPSVFCVILMPTTGICSVSDAFAKSWGNPFVAFIIFCFIFNAAMAETGLSRRIALWFITRKYVRGRPWVFMFSFLLAVLLMSAFSTSSAVAAVFLGIAEQVFANTGYKEGDDLTESMVCSIGWVDQVGQGVTPMSHGATLLGISLSLSLLGVEVSIIQYSIVGIVVGLVFLVAYLFVYRFALRPNMEKLRNVDIEYLKSTVPPISKREKIVIVAFIVLLASWILPDVFKVIPPLAAFGNFIGQVGTYIPVLAVVAVLCVINVDGKPVINLGESSKNVSWNTIYLLTAIMISSSVFDSADAGITAWVTAKAGSIMSGLPPFIFIIIALTWIAVQTNFMSNMVSATMFSALCPIALAIGGVNPVALGLCIGFIANNGFATPAACPVAGFIAGTKWVRPSYMIKKAWYASLVGIVVTLCVAYPLWAMMFPY